MEKNSSRTLRVVYNRYYPAASSDCDVFPPSLNRNCAFPGLMVEILHLLVHELNMTIETIVLPDSHDPYVSASDLQKSLQYVTNGSADTVAIALQPTIERLSNFSFTSPLYRVQTRFLLASNKDIYGGIWSFFSTYDSRTWLTMLIALTMQICLCVMVRQVEIHIKDARPISILESAWQMVRLQLLQPEKVYFKSKAGKLAIISFSLIQCAVLLGVFSSWILSNLLKPNTALPVNSVERLIDRITTKEYHLITRNKGTWFYDEVNRSQAFPFPSLRSAIEFNPVRLSHSVEESLRRVSNGRSIVFVQDDSETYMKAAGRCDLVSLQTDMPITTAHLVLKQNSPLLKDMNQAIQNNVMKIMRICRKYMETWREMKHPTCEKPHQPLGIQPFIGVCAVSLFFMVIATVIFFTELSCGFKSHEKLHKIQPFANNGSLKTFYR
ncbi:hypothetical protein M3Y95_01278900 [Aphelenchoides besseyi]|nr:hypothetical protein M3Y95_01278900 [Aphelenchoides besseyi]